MQEKFGERLNAGMLAAGITSSAQLAKRCGVSRQTAAKWLTSTRAAMSGEHLFKLSMVLNVRVRWLVTGVGIIPVTGGIDTPQIEHAAAILERMTKAQCERWFEMGERMVGTR